MSISVVYLAYFNPDVGYTLETVKSFLYSYKKYYSGIEHSLVFIAKNWNDKTLYKELCHLAGVYKAKIIDLPDDGWDFGAYFRVAPLLDTDYVFFLGSSSNILADNWLLFSYNAFKNDSSIQLVGPMGSYGQVLIDVNFPNPHIRTCAFMIKTKLFVEYASTQKFPVTKGDTYGLEHGNNSITNFILNKGYSVVVVNPDGEIFHPDKWSLSKTFRDPNGCKSIISDRQYLLYLDSDENYKRFLEVCAWGQSLKRKKVKIFVSYHQTESIFQTEVFNPLFLGSNPIATGIFALKDNMGINISNKNNYYGELTGQYWIWKNLLPSIDSEYIGFFHYRRFLDFNISNISNIPFEEKIIIDFKKMFETYSEENIMNFAENFDVILPHKKIMDCNVYEQYVNQYAKSDLDLALEILEDLYPEYKSAAINFMSSSAMYNHLVFLMKKEILFEYFEWIFSILFVLEQRSDWSNKEDVSNAKVPVYIAKILFNIWLEHNIEKKNLKVKNSTSVLVDSDIEAYTAKLLAQIKSAQNA